MPAVPFENTNIDALRFLLRIEVATREVLSRIMSAEHGQTWRKRIPGELLGKIRAAERDEASRRQFAFARLGPLYYLTLGELLPVLRQNHSAAALMSLGGLAFVNELEALLPARNAACHGRPVSAA